MMTNKTRDRPTTPTMLTQARLLDMGWTRKMIDTLLPPPTLKRNPMYKNAAPMKLWDADTVSAIMQTEAYMAEKERAVQRQLASQKAISTKKDRLHREVEQAIQTITVQIIPEDQLYQEALESKQDWFDGFREYRCAATADKATMERWIVNYIRHELTTYDTGLELLAHRPGKQEVYPELKNAILLKIAEVYPRHRKECLRQMVHIPTQLAVQVDAAQTRAAQNTSTLTQTTPSCPNIER